MNRASTLSATDIINRLKAWDDIIGVEGAAAAPPPAAGDIGQDQQMLLKTQKFREVLDTFREIITAMAGPIINTHFAVAFNKKYPDFTFRGGRTVRKIEDIVDWIHAYDPNEPGEMSLEDARAMVHFSIYPIFGKSNHWAEKGEREILDLLGLEYDGNRMSDKIVRKRTTRNGFAKHHCVKKADQLRTKIVDAWARCFNERFFARDNYKPKKDDGKETDSDGNEGGNDGASKASKKGQRKPDKSDLRKYIVICRHHTHMFDGSYLLLEGHPRRKEIDGEVATKTKEQEEREQKELIINRFAANLRNRDLGSLFDSEATGNEQLLALLRSTGLMCSGSKRAELDHPTAHRAAPPAKKLRESEKPPQVVQLVSDQESTGSRLSDSPSSASATSKENEDDLLGPLPLEGDDALKEFGPEPMHVR